MPTEADLELAAVQVSTRPSSRTRPSRATCFAAGKYWVQKTWHFAWRLICRCDGSVAKADEIGHLIWRGEEDNRFNYVSPSVDAQSFSIYFSTIFGSVCYDEDRRKRNHTNIAIPISLPKNIIVGEKLHSLIHTSPTMFL